MQQDQLEHLTSLINASGVLTPEERSSWLAMLPEMNDKQVGELESILVQTQKPSQPVQPTAPSTPLGPPLQSSPPVAAKIFSTTPKPAPAKVPLTHIANLPTGVNFQAPIVSRPRVKNILSSQVPAPQKKVEATPSGSGRFATQLKEILSEKDLPPPHLEPEPLLAKPEKNLLPGQEVSHEKIFQSGPPKQTPPLQKSFEPPRHAPTEFLPPRPSYGSSVQAPVSIPVIPASFFNSPPPPPGSVAKQTNFTQSPKPVRIADRPVAQNFAQPETQKPLREVHLASLQDVSELSVNALHALTAQNLIQVLLALVKKFGYFDVLFALEASPLYEKYLEAGQTVLEQNSSFVKYFQSQGTGLEVKMTKEDFEGMADILRQLQNIN